MGGSERPTEALLNRQGIYPWWKKETYQYRTGNVSLLMASGRRYRGSGTD